MSVGRDAAATAVPLRRNRDFLLLQAGQLLSSSGTQIGVIAYPLLVLALTGSPAKAGFVAFVRTAPLALFSLPAGLAADHWNRKRMMIAADAIRVLAVGCLALALALDGVAFSVIALIAFVEGTGAALFGAAQPGALRAVVPALQLPDATSVQTGRQATVILAGPPLGGVLFGVARALPFVVDALSYAFSTVSLLVMRTPFQETRERERASVRARLGEAFHFFWTQRFLRTSSLLLALANFIGPSVLFAVVVLGKREGLSGGAIGALVALFGGCVLIGSFLSSLVRRLLPVRAVVVLEMWTYLSCTAFLIWPSVYVLAVSIVPTALAIPSTDSVVHGFRIAMTPDRLLGRVESLRITISLLIAPLGPLVAGVLLETLSARATIAIFAAAGLVLAVWGTLSPSMRAAPSLDELASSATASS